MFWCSDIDSSWRLVGRLSIALTLTLTLTRPDVVSRDAQCVVGILMGIPYNHGEENYLIPLVCNERSREGTPKPTMSHNVKHDGGFNLWLRGCVQRGIWAKARVEVLASQVHPGGTAPFHSLDSPTIFGMFGGANGLMTKAR